MPLPLPHMYVLKDLVPDMSNFYEQHKSVRPYLVTKEGADKSVENHQTKQDRAKLDGDQVEWLAMRAMALGLVKGVIDEVQRVVDVAWVAPRVRPTLVESPTSELSMNTLVFKLNTLEF